MPHITIEYSANVEGHVDIRKLVRAIHQTAIDSGVFQTAAIRTRASRRDLYEIADGAPENAFIHVDLNIAPGRDATVRKRVAQAILDVVSEATEPLPTRSALALSVEVREIDNSSAVRLNHIHARLAETAGGAKHAK